MAAEIRINSYTTDFQRNPDVAVLADGSYVVVWQSYFSGASSGLSPVTYVASQHFSADGRRLGDENVVFGGPETASKDVSITALRDGGYVVTWTFDDYDAILTTSSRVYAQVYNANGSERSSAFRVDQTPDKAAAAASAFATQDGGFVITYNVYQSPYNDIYRRAYNATGNALGGQQRLNTVEADNNQFYARSETLSDGRILTAWSSVTTFDNGNPGFLRNEVRASITDATGRVVKADFHLTLDDGTTRQEAGGFDIAALRGGGFAVSHLDDGPAAGPRIAQAVYIDRFNAAGQATGPSTLAHTTNEIIVDSEVLQLASGEIVVVWSQFSEGFQNIGKDVLARVFSQTGRAIGSAFTVSVDRSTTDEQENIRAVALRGGGFIVTYESESIDGDEEGIAARSFGRGTSGNDVLRMDQSGVMAGLGGDDRLIGNFRGNTLSGGAGLDTLSGFGGADSFLFERPRGADVITDFSDADRIVLMGDGFGGLARGALAASAFKALGRADANDRILYDAGTGALYFDANGSEQGGRVQFASLVPETQLTFADFLVI